MHNDDHSVWKDTTEAPTFAPLTGDTSADVCVVGAGIGGLTTAYMLLREGKSVVVIDGQGIGAGETGRSTAHLFPPDERFADIEPHFGSDKLRLVADSFRRATDCVEAIIRIERIDCEFERLPGFLFNRSGRWDTVLEREYAVTTRLGMNVRRFERIPGLYFDSGPCLRFDAQAQFHPLKYVHGLARAITRLGGRIHDHTLAEDVRGGERLAVHCAQGAVEAKSVVVATNTPFQARLLKGKQDAYRSYVLGLRVPKDAIPRLLMWDTGTPYYYVRLAGAGDGAAHELLLVGGQDRKHDHEQFADERYENLEAWARARFPMAGEVDYRWSGLVMEPTDGLAYLGRNAGDEGDIYIITGDSGNGMTHCTAGAMLVTDLILGRPNTWSALYSPARAAFHGSASFSGW
ncbi:MAG: FAD-binding oxidoreductase [Massilia sp.]|nr:FAD-binding oxidoreductase [Massilia sp.]